MNIIKSALNHFIYHTTHIALLVLVFNQISCDSNKKDDLGVIEKVEFNVNYEKLSNYYTFSDSSTIFYPPKKWNKNNKSDVYKLNEKLSDDVIDIILEDIFTSPGGSYILISKVQSEKSNFNYIPEDFLELMKTQFGVDNIIYHTFFINNILVREYLIDTEEVIIFKNFINSNNQNYQLDYIILKNSYNEDIESIESSIGSLNRKG